MFNFDATLHGEKEVNLFCISKNCYFTINELGTVRGKLIIHFFFYLSLERLCLDKIFQCNQLRRTILCSPVIMAGRLYIRKKERRKSKKMIQR